MVVKDPTREAEHVIAPALQDELLRHQGRWVAITRSKLVAIGDSPAEVVRLAQEKGAKRPMIYRVPSDHSTTFLL